MEKSLASNDVSIRKVKIKKENLSDEIQVKLIFIAAKCDVVSSSAIQVSFNDLISEILKKFFEAMFKVFGAQNNELIFIRFSVRVLSKIVSPVLCENQEENILY